LEDFYVNPIVLTSGITTPIYFGWVDLKNAIGVSSFGNSSGTCSVNGFSVARVEIQIQARNAIRNGGFEWFTLGESYGLPSGFTQVYSSNPAYYHLQVVNRDGRESAVAVLSGTGDLKPGTGGNSGLSSESTPVFPQSLYFFGGWVRQTPETISGIAIGWYRDSDVALDQYIIPPTPSRIQCVDGEWQFLAELVVSPAEARYARLWLTNTNGESEFDDVFLIRIPESPNNR
jgi:hypothetical protein